MSVRVLYANANLSTPGLSGSPGDSAKSYPRQRHADDSDGPPTSQVIRLAAMDERKKHGVSLNWTGNPDEFCGRDASVYHPFSCTPGSLSGGGDDRGCTSFGVFQATNVGQIKGAARRPPCVGKTGFLLRWLFVRRRLLRRGRSRCEQSPLVHGHHEGLRRVGNRSSLELEVGVFLWLLSRLERSRHR